MFTRKTDLKIKKSVGVTLAAIGFAALSAYFGFRNHVTDVGYRPEQPVPFSHKLHAGDLQIKCMYCHTGVEKSAHSTVPPTQTCMNCHVAIKTESPKLQQVRDSWEKGEPIEWRKVHKLPDYVAFNHSRHIRAMIDCKSCHGEVEKMGVVTQMQPLSMGWCLDCHRDPQSYVTPAREISGIFTGLRANYAEEAWKGELTGGDGKWQRSDEKGVLGVGNYEHNVGKSDVAGIPMPKQPALGPENCSACHY